MVKNNRLFITSNLFIRVNKRSAVSLMFLYTHCSYLCPFINALPAPSTIVTFHSAQQPHLLLSRHAYSFLSVTVVKREHLTET